MPTILVIDADERYRTSVVAALRTSGYDVLPAADCAEGLDHVRNVRLHMVIVDPNLAAHGIEAIGQLRQSSPEMKILLLAHSGQLTVEHYIDVVTHLGAARVVEKSLSMEALVSGVASVLKG